MKKKTMRRAMISSILALVVCFAMLIGTTYAWFTDSVASSGNIIKSGTLDIDLLVKGGNIPADNTFVADAEGYYSVSNTANEALKLFNYDLWEPGYTVWANAKVENLGTLALKYTMKLVSAASPVAADTTAQLADVIDVYYAASEVAQPADRNLSALTKLGTLSQVLSGEITVNDTLLAGEKDYATLALKMQESAGNEYQNLQVGASFDIQILATQYTYEEDSFDNQYDANALYPDALLVSTPADLNAALNNPAIETVVISEDMVIPAEINAPYGNKVGVVQNGTTIDGGDNGVTITGNGNTYGILTYGGTIKNITITGAQRGIVSYTPTEDVILDHVTIENCGYTFNTAEHPSGDIKLIATNSSFSGWTSFAGLTSASFTNCNFGLGSYWQGYGYDADYDRLIKPYVTTVFENCEFVENFYIDLSSLGAGCTVTIKNCTVNGVTLTAENYASYIFIEDYSPATVIFA